MKNIKTFETFSINEKGMNPGFAAYLAKKKKGKKGEEKGEEKEEKEEKECKCKVGKKSKKKNESVSDEQITELFLEASSNSKFDIEAVRSFKNENPEVVKNPTYIENLKKYYPQISKQIR